MRKALFPIGIGLVLVTLGACNEARSPVGVPNDVKASQETIEAWMNKLKNCTDDQIVKQFGKPTETSTWEWQGKNELLLRYKTDKPNSILALYFVEDRVITVSLQILST